MGRRYGKRHRGFCVRTVGTVCVSICVLTALLCLAAAFRDTLPSTSTFTVAAEPRAHHTPVPFVSEEGVHVNTASKEELMRLPGISLKIAERIMEARDGTPFYFVEDLKTINGIGDKRLEALRSLVVVP